VGMDEEGYYQADLDYCKGCGLCSHQCPTGCISMEEEVARLPWQVR
jgi:pyruvate ferredoxin oxidoreductase delta subunit